MKIEVENLAQEIKSRIDLTEEFRADGRELVKHGADWKCCCPFHEENTASCVVHSDFFKCFGCGAKGDALNYLALITKKDLKLDFFDVLREGCLRTGIEFPEQSSIKVPKEPAKIYPTIEKVYECCEWICGESKLDGAKGTKNLFVAEKNESRNPDTDAIEFVEVRLESKTEKRNGGKGKPVKEFKQIQATDGGFIFGLTGKKTPLFNRKKIREKDIVVLVEGCKCMRLLHAIGKDSNWTVTCAAGGSNNPVSNVDWTPLAGKTVVRWPDNDDGGKDFMQETEVELQKIGCRICDVDLTDLKLEPKDDVVDFYQGFIGTPDEKKAKIHAIIDATTPETLESQMAANINGTRYAIRHEAFYALSSTLCFLPGSVTMLCASPGTSKSFLVLQWIWQLFFDGIDASALALEKNAAFHETRTVAQMAGQAGYLDPKWQFDNPDETCRIYETYRPFIERIRKEKVIQCPGQSAQITPAYLLRWVAEEIKRGRKMLAIDPITKMETESENFWKEQQKFVRDLVGMVERSQVRLILVTHPRKGAQGMHMDNMAGAVAFSQNTDTNLWLVGHETLFQSVPDSVNPMESKQVKYNRTIHILKAKLGPVAKPTVGFWYGANLKHEEVGFVENAG